LIYTVNESFYTFQGEGDHAGRASFFIRLQGCDQACSWCDAASTWHRDWKPEGLWKGTADEVAAIAGNADRVVITGGEPCLYDLDALITALNRDVAVETAGHKPLPGARCWVTLSPKPDSIHPLEASVKRADEFKIIVSDSDTLWRGLECIGDRTPGKSVWLHPEWSKRNDPDVLRLIVETVKEQAGDFRAGWQMHKNYMADLMDLRARKDYVPLGGTNGDPY
jgi:organic radical activating enzyme